MSNSDNYLIIKQCVDYVHNLNIFVKTYAKILLGSAFINFNSRGKDINCTDLKKRIDLPLCYAASIGNINFLERAKIKEIFIADIIFCHVSIAAGQLASLIWANDNNCKLSCFNHGNAISIYAVKNNYCDILKWLKENGNVHKQRYYRDIIIPVIKYNNITIIEWLHEEGLILSSELCVYAARYGNLTILKWLRDNGCEWKVKVCREAAKYGHFEILKWLKDNECPWDHTTCSAAAAGGNLEILQWARSKDCPWNSWVCVYATKYGYFHIVKWIIENGSKWTKPSCDRAKEYERTGIHEWIKKKELCKCVDTSYDECEDDYSDEGIDLVYNYFD